MIVPMKHLDLVCLAADREHTLERLRQLGAVHLDLASAAGIGVAAAKGEAELAVKAVRLVLKAREGMNADDLEIRPRTIAEVMAIDADRATLAAERDRLGRLIRVYAPYGDFDPILAARVSEAARRLSPEADVAAALGLPEKLPEMRLSRLEEKLARVENRLRIDEARLAAVDEKAILKHYPELADRIAFESAKELMRTEGALAFISGWIPVPRLSVLMDEVRGGEDLFERAAKPGWGVLVRDPAEGETPPTLVEPPRFFRPMKALFAGIGIAPGYTEGDVSVPFMCYFALFFAMLVGDGAYGLIFLAATAWGWRKHLGAGAAARNPVTGSWLVLLTVFSAATVVWGLLSNTWFGANLPWCADWPMVKWLADPSYHNMMLLCFTIGVSHLMLARIWNGVCRAPDSTAIAEFGWAGVLLFMYLVTNLIVGIFQSIPQWGFWVFGVSLVAVFGFTLKPSELKSRGAELGMLPLSIMSALGDIISYVRLFAVGLASVKVAENFNAMATGLLSPEHAWWLNAVLSLAMVAILLVGHALNLAMAGLSILVHAVRLNTLEFSNHKGVTWSGYAFSPFMRKGG